MKRKKKRNKKKKLLIITLIAIILISLSIGGYLFFKSKILYVSFKKNIEININEEAYNTDYVKDIINGELISKKEKIDTSKLGEKKITIKVKDYFKKEKEYTYKVNIVDKEPPTIEFNSKLSTTEGTNIDLLKDVKAKDNSNEEIKVEVVGDYDINKPNTYELYYVAKDSSGNEKKEKFTLEVKKKPTVTENNNTNPDTTFTTSKGFSGYTKNGVTYIDGVLIANKTYSLPKSYGSGLTGSTQSAFNKLHDDAATLGYNLTIGSGYRSYNTQANLYNNYVARDGKAAADTYSARAGHSEHQTGLAFDVCEHSSPDTCINNGFDDTAQAKWISDNCYKYGLIIRYPKGKSNETGYMYESWHLRYVGVELATKLYNNGNWITLEDYFGITSKYNY